MDGRRFGRNDPCPCGSGRKYKQCCLNSSRYQNTAMPTPRGVYGEGVALLPPPPRQPPRRFPSRTTSAVTRVSVDYVFSEEFGQAEVNYCFEVGRLIPLDGGFVVPVERLQAGMRFLLDNGSVATVTAVEPPKVWEPPPSEPNEDGNYLRRVIGRVKRTGFIVLDLYFGGQTITTTPGHLFYSLDRRGWVGADALHVGSCRMTREIGCGWTARAVSGTGRSSCTISRWSSSTRTSLAVPPAGRRSSTTARRCRARRGAFRFRRRSRG